VISATVSLLSTKHQELLVFVIYTLFFAYFSPVTEFIARPVIFLLGCSENDCNKKKIPWKAFCSTVTLLMINFELLTRLELLNRCATLVVCFQELYIFKQV